MERSGMKNLSNQLHIIQEILHVATPALLRRQTGSFSMTFGLIKDTVKLKRNGT